MKTQEDLNNNQSPSDEEFDFKILLDFVLRNKSFIGILSFLFFLIAFLYSLTMKKVWEGQFQIVLSSQNNTLSNLNPLLGRIATNQGNANNLATQVGILKSPSVLMPIFEFVNLQKKNNQDDPQENFRRWEKQLNIELERNTSILNISYQDTDKELIVPALKKMSLIYQEYSGKKVKRQQMLSRDVLNNQIGIYKKKSFDSLKKVQEYAIDQDLIFFDTNTQRSTRLQNFPTIFAPNLNADSRTGMNQNSVLTNIDIESQRVRAANEIRNIDSQLKKIEQIDDIEEIQYMASLIPALVEEGLPKQLGFIMNELIEKRTIYKEEDKSIQKLVERKNVLVKLNKERAIGHLRAKRSKAEAMLDATSRPKEVLLKYKDLMREASRDENSLISLENQLQDIEINLAKQTDPWELITSPLVLKNPVAPSKRKISLFGFVGGFIIGSFIAYLKEKNFKLGSFRT